MPVAQLEPEAAPEPFRSAVASLRAAEVTPLVTLREIKPPQRLAPWAFALAATLDRGGHELAVGRFIVLHDPAGQEAWSGRTRVVGYIRAEIDDDMAADPLLPDVAWAWLLDALDAHEATHVAAGGTVTRTSSARYGVMFGTDDSNDIELRCSWTPLQDAELAPHLGAFCDVICHVAGVPTEPGVVPLPLSHD